MGDKVRALRLAGTKRADSRLLGDPERLRSRAESCLAVGGTLNKKRLASLSRLAQADMHRAKALEASRTSTSSDSESEYLDQCL